MSVTSKSSTDLMFTAAKFTTPMHDNMTASNTQNSYNETQKAGLVPNPKSISNIS